VEWDIAEEGRSPGHTLLPSGKLAQLILARRNVPFNPSKYLESAYSQRNAARTASVPSTSSTRPARSM
jgi:hypothetical protein